MQIFWLTYRMKKFGSETEYSDQDILMGVATNGGVKDARATCEHYHSGCKIMKVEETKMKGR